ncbi:thioredoxin family protein [Aquimarina sp. D1M17]|uniref:thioredoxin family protein n=1 Tax=Aquimarina acroporae TaxID=2937283 RepID=UPI0020BED494|nr:thioredoxin family protein [Aquimarina acroporae]MCK8522721.1 thioredoxin family protein [Aquimarina acroporae]
MKKIIPTLLFILMGFQLISAQEWLNDFEIAKKIAVENDRPIVLVFAGSDWCIPCIKLERQILHTEEFKTYAKDHYVLLKADFPRKRKNQLPQDIQRQNASLAEEYNRSGGFPMVVVLDKTGQKLGEIGYEKVTPSAYIESLNTLIK